MEKTIQEIEEIAKKIKTDSKLDYRLKTAEPGTRISVNITLHARNWQQILFLMAYYTEKGSRGYDSLSSAVYRITDRAYKGLLNSINKKSREEAPPSPQKPKEDPKPDDGDEGGQGGDPFDFI